jgi:hypothetical protein
MDNSDWRKHQKASWPTGSLERTLIRDYPGCKSLLEALKQRITPKQDVTPTESPAGSIERVREIIVKESELDKYLALRESIKSIANYVHLGFDTWQVAEHIRLKLNAMPITSIEEAYLWRDYWKAEIKKIREQNNG